MSDTKEHLERRIADSLACGKHLDAAEYITLLVQLVADEAANLGGKTICTYPVVPDGDVPEWFHKAACGGSMSSHKVRALWEKVEAEISRRVAEATQRIIDSYGMTAKCFEESRDKWKAFAENRLADCNELTKATADKDARIAALEKNLDYLLDKIPGAVRVCESGGPEDVNKSIAVSVVKLLGERDALKQQLAAAQAEVERVRKFADSMEDELTKLRAENARLTRPVEGVEELVELTCKESFASFDAVSWLSVKSLMANAAKKAIQRERSARVAADKRATDAEAERDELREAWKRMRVLMNCGSKDKFYRVRIDEECLTDDDIESLLVAFREFRAEKAKVQQ